MEGRGKFRYVVSCLLLFFLSQEVNLRRIREENFLLNFFAGREIRLLVFDFDYTLALGGKLVSDELLDLLYDLNKRDYKIVIITGAFLSSIRERFITPMQQKHSDFGWENIFIATNLGSEAYRFDKKGREIPIYRKKISQDQNVKIEEALGEFRERYGDQILESGYDNEYKFFVTFKDPEKVDEYGNFFKEKLGGFNLRVTCAGRCKTLEFSPYHKGDAIDKIRKSFFPNIANEGILIIGDSFTHKYSNDRTMLINGSLIFNVGRNTIGSPVVSLSDLFLQEDGPTRTAKILKALLKLIESIEND
jgi:hydroxymethylpyrimidine pyrophosphatase-like HAD family hydrolase